MLTEFGATDDLPTIAADIDAADRHMDSWQYWTYSGGDPCCPRPVEGIILDPSKPPTPGNLKQGKLDVLSRPYPRAVAGVPTSWSFESAAANQAFTFVYRADPRVRAPTEIFIPVSRHYLGGYTVHVTGPAIVISLAGAAILTLWNTGTGVVTVQVARA
jgi:endoglycosylceramidase